MSGLFGCFFVLLIGTAYSLTIGDSKLNMWRLKICGIVSAIYITSALVVSFSFDNGNFFLVSDPCKYIERTQLETWSFSLYMRYLRECYFEFADNNALYNVGLNYVSYIYKTYFDGVTPFSLTLTSVLFGVLSSITLFRILSAYYPFKKAYKFTLAFSLLSLFHFYSVVVIRDISIAFVYLLCIEIILKNYSTKRLILLIIFMFIAWGLRLYSGLFIFLFILYYIYTGMKKGSAIVFVPMLLFGIIYFVISSMSIIEQSMEEIELYSEFTLERAANSNGLITSLLSLPPVIKELALTLYSQITPFPPYLSFNNVSTFSNFYMSSMVMVYEIWWYSVSFSLLYVLFVKSRFFHLPDNYKLLYIIAMFFIIVNTAHPDIRRMMPVYPILFLFYLRLKYQEYGQKKYQIIQIELFLLYLVLLIAYFAVKG